MYDAIVVGARCAGSPTAMLLARKGYRVLIVDRATFPSDTFRNHGITASRRASSCSEWGLLDRVRRHECPAGRAVHAGHGRFPADRHACRWWTASAALYAPRRRCWTRSWSRPPWRPGAELREGFSVQRACSGEATAWSASAAARTAARRSTERARPS